MTAKYSVPPLKSGTFASSDADALVLVGPVPFDVPGLPDVLRTAVEGQLAADPELGRGQTAVVACAEAPGGRLILAPTGDLGHWTEDVRRYSEAVAGGVLRAISCGARAPALAIVPDQAQRFGRTHLVAAATAAAAAWRHPQLRNDESAADQFWLIGDGFDAESLQRAAAMEIGRALARDLTGGDPEFTAPEGFAAICEAAFAGSAVTVEVDRDTDKICSENPLLGAVARASLAIERHHPRIVKLTYDGGDGPRYFFAGKGVTYDTGGADLKVGGSMAGMSMDKGGAAGVAGFFATLAAAKPKGFKATAWLGCVRNSIGADAYVADEIMESRGGVRVVIGNTDAEGRMVLGDMLAAMRADAESAGNAVMFSVATLTGHVGRAYGPYASVMANGAAVEGDWPRRLQQAGELFGDPFEWSVIRREDYDMIAPKSAGGPLLQCNSSPSVSTPRGHQFPFCFLERVSGLDRHDLGAEVRVPYMHLDIAFSVAHKGGPFDGRPSGAPVPALVGLLLGW